MVESTLKDMLIASEAIRYGDFTLASGKKSRIYVDIKKAITSPEILRVIAREICAMNLAYDAAAGVAVGGVPLAVSLSLEAGKPYIIIRKEQKDHGLSGLIIGQADKKKILLIEDVTTSGGSAVFGIDEIRRAGGIIDTLISVVDRDEGAAEKLAAVDVRLIPLVSMQDLLNG